MTTHRIIITLILLLCTRALCAQDKVIKAGHVFDARSGKMLDQQIIVISNGKIKKVGTNLAIAKADTVIDLSDSWVLPGLMDCHVHLTMNFPHRTLKFGELYTKESNAYRAMRGAHNAKIFLEGGFTTIKEIGNDGDYVTAEIVKAIKNNWITGPDILYAGKIIAPYGGQTTGISIENERLWAREYLDADTPDEIKKAIRKNAYYGASTIKLATGDNGIYNSEDIQAAVEEARKYNMKVSVHVIEGEAATNVITGGAASIEHGFGLNDTQLKAMKEKGVFLVGTDFSFSNWYAYGMDSASAKSMESQVIDRLKRAYKIGTKMAFGTDIIIDLPQHNKLQTGLEVLKTWKAAGIPRAYVLQAMTVHAAELMGVEKTKGVIEAAYVADIVATKSNPLDDLEAIKKIHFVMKDGKVVKSE